MNIPTFPAHSQLQSSPKGLSSRLDISGTVVSEAHLREFQSNVQLSADKLEQLLHQDLYLQQAIEMNEKGLQLISEGLLPQGGILLGEAQKVLQFAVNKGKQIPRTLIKSVLHNQAYCSQQQWDLQRCGNYIQALIYNLNCQLNPAAQMITAEQIQTRSELAHYYLLFCAINSQLKNNDAALIAAKKAYFMVKNNAEELAEVATKSKINKNSVKMMEEIASLPCSAQNMSNQVLLAVAANQYQMWRDKVNRAKGQLGRLQRKFKEFTIGNLMQIQPLIYTNSTSQPSKLNLQPSNLLQSILLLSISYYTMATQLRLLASARAPKQEAKQLSQYKQSQCYHLMAIIIVVHYLGFQMKYLQHIIGTLEKHYKIRIGEIEIKQTSKTYKILVNKKQKLKEQISKDTGSSRNSRKSQLKSPQSHHLQSLVRASLPQSQQEQFNRLDNYYYVRPDLANSKEQLRISTTRPTQRQKGTLTSRQSTHKTPKGYTPNHRSPKKSKCNSVKTSKQHSKKPSLEHNGEKRNHKVIQEYFHNGTATDTLKPKTNRKRSEHSKENKQYALGLKIKKNVSPQGLRNNQCFPAAHRQSGKSSKSKENRQLRSVKSGDKLKAKLEQTRSKKHSQLHK